MDTIADNWLVWLAAFLLGGVAFVVLGIRKVRGGGDTHDGILGMVVLAAFTNASFILLAIAIAVHLIRYAKM